MAYSGAASAAATIQPISTLDAVTNINFGNGVITQPTENKIDPTTSTSATAAEGGGVASDSAGINTGLSTTEKILIGTGIAVAVVGAFLVYHYRKKLF